MREHRRSCIPAAGHDWLLPLYDPLLKLLGADSTRRELVEQASVRTSHRVLDIGCGTGSLVVLIKRLYPDSEAVGLDPDPKALARARRKVERARLSAQFDQGFSDELPYPDASFDRVFSSFMFHHLKRDEKAKTLNEARRVLKPGGSLHVLDFGGAEPRRENFLARTLHSAEHMRDNFDGRIPALMREAGFAESNELAHRATLVGRIAYYAASLPAAKAGL
jgi:ubiquinone/menaquinone biosynthesis C-methylase UbiE